MNNSSGKVKNKFYFFKSKIIGFGGQNIYITTFLMPTLVILTGIMLYPIIITIYMSISKVDLVNFTFEFIGFENFLLILKNPRVLNAVKNTIYWLVFGVMFQFIIGFGAALLLNSKPNGEPVFGLIIFKTILIIPWTLAAVVTSLNWRWLLHAEFGIINWFFTNVLRIFSSPLLDNSVTAFPTLIMVDVWRSFPFIMLMIYSALQSVPNTHYEAAAIDGASPIQVLQHVILPWVKPVAKVVIILRTVWTLNEFTIVKVMTGGGPAGKTDILGMHIYQRGFVLFKFEEAAALSVITLIISIIIIYIYNKVLKEE